MVPLVVEQPDRITPVDLIDSQHRSDRGGFHRRMSSQCNDHIDGGGDWPDLSMEGSEEQRQRGGACRIRHDHQHATTNKIFDGQS